MGGGDNLQQWAQKKRLSFSVGAMMPQIAVLASLSLTPVRDSVYLHASRDGYLDSASARM